MKVEVGREREGGAHEGGGRKREVCMRVEVGRGRCA